LEEQAFNKRAVTVDGGFVERQPAAGGSVPTFATVQEAEAWAVSRGIAGEVYFSEWNVDLANRATMRLDELHSRYNHEPLKAITSRGSSTSWAKVSFREETGNIMGFNKNIGTAKETIIGKFGDQFRNGFNVYVKPGEEFEAIITHEFGHTIAREQTLTIDELSTIKNIRGRWIRDANNLARTAGIDSEAFRKVAISDYARINTSEFIAEAFTQYNHGIYRSPYTNEVMEVINKRLK